MRGEPNQSIHPVKHHSKATPENTFFEGQFEHFTLKELSFISASFCSQVSEDPAWINRQHLTCATKFHHCGSFSRINKFMWKSRIYLPATFTQILRLVWQKMSKLNVGGYFARLSLHKSMSHTNHTSAKTSPSNPTAKRHSSNVQNPCFIQFIPSWNPADHVIFLHHLSKLTPFFWKETPNKCLVQLSLHKSIQTSKI